jgi:hypothetical protein
MKKNNFNSKDSIKRIAELIDMYTENDSNEDPYEEFPEYEENAIFQSPEEIGSGGEGYAPIPTEIDPKETQGYAPGTTSVVEEDNHENHGCECVHETPEEDVDVAIDELVRLDSGDQDVSDGKEVVQEFVITPFK